MYVNDDYRPADPTLGYTLIDELVFGTLATFDGELDSSHIPFMVERERGARGTLIGHLDRRNPQCEALARSRRALASFIGPHSYVSPDWYRTAPHVPTWYYVTVQVRGAVTMISGAEPLVNMVTVLSERMEPSDSRWRPDGVREYTQRLVQGIVGFEIAIEDIQTQVRIGQQNSAADRADVRRELRAGDCRQRDLAAWIERYESPS